MKMGLCFAITMWVALVVLSGCASIRGAESGKGVEIDVYLIADEDINQDVLGVPSPVRLSFLQLTSEIEFRQMNQMNTEDLPYKDFLGSSVAHETNVMLRPGQVLEFKLPLQKDTRYLGVVTAYRDDNSHWKNTLQRQDKRWYQIKDNEFLYLQVTSDTVIQLSKSEALDMLMTLELKNQGVDISKLSSREKRRLRRQVRRHMGREPRPDLAKGYFANQNITSTKPAEMPALSLENLGDDALESTRGGY